MFTCSSCSSVHNTAAALRVHRARKHEKLKIVSCIHTKKSYSLQEFNRLSEVRYKNCPQCSKDFFTTEATKKFCSQSCATSHSNANKPRRTELQRERARAVAIRNESHLYFTGSRRSYTSKTHTSKTHTRGASTRGASTSKYVAPGRLLVCGQCSAEFTAQTAKFCSKKCANRAANPNPQPIGGCRQRSGRSKYGYYGDLWCQSTYEMAFVWSCIRDGKHIVRNTEGFPYANEDGVQRLFFPDFIVDGKYVEVKGWMTEQTRLKIEAFPHDIEVMVGDPMLKILSEAMQHFGTKNLAEIYAENPKPRKFTGTMACVMCETEFEIKSKKSTYCSRQCAGRHRATLRKKVDRP